MERNFIALTKQSKHWSLLLCYCGVPQKEIIIWGVWVGNVSAMEEEEEANDSVAVLMMCKL